MPEKYNKLQNFRKINLGRKEKDTYGIYPKEQ